MTQPDPAQGPQPTGQATVTSVKRFVVEDILGNQEAQENLLVRLRRRIEKEGLKLINTSGLPATPMWDLKFPPKRLVPTLDDIQLLALNGDVAWEILVQYNLLNRPVELEKVVDYAIDMVTGRWHESTHQGIAFTYEPAYQDGQHRLLALYLACLLVKGLYVKFYVFFNRDPAARNKIDTGRNRSSADKLVMNLKNNTGALFMNNKYGNIPAKTIYTVVSSMPSCKYLNEDAKLKFAEKNLELVAEMLEVLVNIRGLRLHAAWAGVFVDAALFFGKDAILPLAKRLANNSWEQMQDSRVDPLFCLHSRLVEDKSRATKLTAQTICALAVFAIRKALLKESVTFTRNSKGTRQEARFPKFSQAEGEDFKKNKEKSKILKKNSVSREEKTKKSNSIEMEDGMLEEDLVGIE